MKYYATIHRAWLKRKKRGKSVSIFFLTVKAYVRPSNLIKTKLGEQRRGIDPAIPESWALGVGRALLHAALPPTPTPLLTAPRAPRLYILVLILGVGEGALAGALAAAAAARGGGGAAKGVEC